MAGTRLMSVIGLLLLVCPALGADAAPKSILPAGQTERDLRAFLLRHTPRFIPGSDMAEWTLRAERLRERVLNEVILKGFPTDCASGPVNVVWGDTLPGQGYTIRKLRYEAVPGLWVGALLYEPSDLKGRVPAVLNPNGHVGKPGLTVDYKQVRCINLAKRGMLALSTEFIGMGQLRDGLGHGELSYLDLCGRSGVGVFYLALKRGLDVLCEHESADLDRIAVTGLSGGGWQTILISSLDTRVKLAAPNAGYITLDRRIWNPADTGDREQNPTDLVSVADYADLTALLTPRPALLIYNVKDDCCFQSEFARPAVFEPVVPLYETFGVKDLFEFHVNHDPGTHNYLKENREAFYRFINRHFLPEDQRQDEDLPVDSEVRPQEELAIEYPFDNGTWASLAKALMDRLPVRRVPQDKPARLDRWRSETRDILRELVRPEDFSGTQSDALALSTISHEVKGTPGYGRHLRVGQAWTLPMVEFSPKGKEKKLCHIIFSDDGVAGAVDVVGAVLERGESAIVADLLFIGECMGVDGQGWKYAQMVSTVGRRCLGIQVSQIDAVIKHVRERDPDCSLRVIARGRKAGLAALVSTALDPGRVDHLELREMDASLKDWVAKGVSYGSAPSVFCFGLLQAVDVPELVELAKPTPVKMDPSK